MVFPQCLKNIGRAGFSMLLLHISFYGLPSQHKQWKIYPPFCHELSHGPSSSQESTVGKVWKLPSLYPNPSGPVQMPALTWTAAGRKGVGEHGFGLHLPVRSCFPVIDKMHQAPLRCVCFELAGNAFTQRSNFLPKSRSELWTSPSLRAPGFLTQVEAFLCSLST